MRQVSILGGDGMKLSTHVVVPIAPAAWTIRGTVDRGILHTVTSSATLISLALAGTHLRSTTAAASPLNDKGGIIPTYTGIACADATARTSRESTVENCMAIVDDGSAWMGRSGKLLGKGRLRGRVSKLLKMRRAMETAARHEGGGRAQRRTAIFGRAILYGRAFCAPGNWFPRDLIRKILPPRPPFHADGAVGRADGALLTARVARKAVEPALEAAHKLAGFTREPQSMRCPFEAPTNVELFC